MPHYPPLHARELCDPDNRLVAWLTKTLVFSPEFDEQHLFNQVKVRDPIPSAAWGSDQERANFGRQVADLIGERIGWPNGHFIPEDPFELVVYVIGGEDFEHTEVVMALEETLELPVDDVEWEIFMQWTLGEVVDYLRSNRMSDQCTVLHSRLLPFSEPQRLEAKYCPMLAAFIDIRSLLSGCRYQRTEQRVLPSSGLRDMHEDILRRLDWCLDRRFSIGASPIRPYAPMKTAVVSTFSTVVASWLMGLFGGVVAMCSGASLSEMFLCAGWFAGLAVAVGGSIIIFQLLSVLVTRDYWRVRSELYRRVETVGDLVEWVVARRNQLGLQS